MSKLKKVGKKERRIFGVCGGISRYIDPELDPVLIRLLWIVLTVFSPLMILLYFGLAIALNTHEDEFDAKKWEKEVPESKPAMEVKIDGKEVTDEDLEEEKDSE